TIPRPTLTARLLADRSRVVVLSAPPGYGKTSLLRQWSLLDPRPFAWLSLGSVPSGLSAADGAATLLTYVVLALQRVEPVDVGPLPGPGETEDLGRTALPRLGRELTRRRRRFVLVLDDVDAVTDPRAVEVLRVLADHVPAGSQLVLAGTAVPPLVTGRLHAAGRMLLLEGADLAMRREEAASLLAAEGLRLDRAAVSRLTQLTEGWAAGLYAAALALHEEPSDRGSETRVAGGLNGESKHAVVTRFVDDARVLTDYLRDELLLRLPRDVQLFMLGSCVLDELSGAACDALLRTTGSGEVLRELADRNLFLTRVPGRPGRYRFHRLVSQVLRAELHRRDAALELELHRRASVVCAQRGDLEQALTHAVAAGDLDRAGRLLWGRTPVLLAKGSRAELERWVWSLPSAQVLTTPWLCLVAAWCSLETGGQVEPWMAAAERGAERYAEPDRRQVTAALATLRAAVGARGVLPMLEDARLALALHEPEDEWRALGAFLEGSAAHLLGDRSASRRSLESSSYLADVLELPSVRALALAQMGLLDVEQQDWRRAEARIRRAWELLGEHDLGTTPTMAPVVCAWTLLLARWGDVERARAAMHRARRLMVAVQGIAPWFAVQSRVVLARSCLLIGEPDDARTLLAEAQQLLASVPDAPVLQEWTDECWRGLQSLPVTAQQAAASLTAAELRVLQFLPSYLSFEEIGRRLSLSRNTVKTQAIAAYRKLGVTSRAAAVERARVLGLVGWSPSEGPA
ncbi:MAG TPA: LuxR C-terminal-related transcriptional regulator, partial [Marmoricola sp.]|nr:LuxR C-terminal-related transcriptional regulator [Marmoricola sp.]